MTKAQADAKWAHWVETYNQAKTISEVAVTVAQECANKVRQELNEEFGTSEWTFKYYSLIK